MEPGFYRCGKCNRSWSRMEPKWGRPSPRICTHCGAGPEDQGIDQAQEDAYCGRVYGPIVDALTGGIKKQTPEL